MSGLVCKAIITTMDNLPLLKVQLPILRDDPLITEIIVVNQGSLDGTEAFLAEQEDVIAINKENDGAGKGRNAGIDAAGQFDYALFLDGGMRPLRPGIEPMVDWMQEHPECDVLGLAWHDLETDVSKAWRRWPRPVAEMNVYQYRMLSLTNYCLTNARAWDDIRFTEEGPFGEAGWGADDDELAYQWREAGVNVYAIEGAAAYRRGSGSFSRLFKETGIWPNQYGSNYEQRVVWLQHNWPQHMPGQQWGEPWLTVVVKAQDSIQDTATLIKAAHERLRERRFGGDWSQVWNPYSIVLWLNGDSDELRQWAESRHLHQHHGDTILLDGHVVRRGPETEAAWAGDFRLWDGEDWQVAVRPDAHYYALATDGEGLRRVLDRYQEEHPQAADVYKDRPQIKQEEL